MSEMTIKTPHIVMGNMKLGKNIPNINVPPTLTCRADAPCSKGCYARKGNFLFQNVIKSHQENLDLFLANPKEYFDGIIRFLNSGLISYKFFRWHSSGDVVNKTYMEGMIRVAKECPQTQFLAFTKKYELWNAFLDEGGKIPNNLNVVFSYWDKLFTVNNPHNLPRTYVDFRLKTMNPKFPEEYYQCPGDCNSCQHCWKLKGGESVVFHQH